MLSTALWLAAITDKAINLKLIETGRLNCIKNYRIAGFLAKVFSEFSQSSPDIPGTSLRPLRGLVGITPVFCRIISKIENNEGSQEFGLRYTSLPPARWPLGMVRDLRRFSRSYPLSRLASSLSWQIFGLRILPFTQNSLHPPRQ